MNTELDEQNKKIFINNVVEAVIRISLLLLMASWCFDISRPFLIMIVWGIIIAVASHPLYIKLCKYLPGSHAFASIVFTLALLGILFVPTIILSATAIESATDLARQLKSGDLVIPHPSENVKSWPLVGPWLSDLWALASENISAALEQIRPQLKSTGLWLLQMVKSAGASLLSFIVAIIIAGVILANAKKGERLAHQFALRIMGEQGHKYTELAGKNYSECYTGDFRYIHYSVFVSRSGFHSDGCASCGFMGISLFITRNHSSGRHAYHTRRSYLCDVDRRYPAGYRFSCLEY